MLTRRAALLQLGNRLQQAGSLTHFRAALYVRTDVAKQRSHSGADGIAALHSAAPLSLGSIADGLAQLTGLSASRLGNFLAGVSVLLNGRPNASPLSTALVSKRLSHSHAVSEALGLSGQWCRRLGHVSSLEAPPSDTLRAGRDALTLEEASTVYKLDERAVSVVPVGSGDTGRPGAPQAAGQLHAQGAHLRQTLWQNSLHEAVVHRHIDRMMAEVELHGGPDAVQQAQVGGMSFCRHQAPQASVLRHLHATGDRVRRGARC